MNIFFFPRNVKGASHRPYHLNAFPKPRIFFFLQCMSQGNGPIPSQGEAVSQELAVMSVKNLGRKDSLVARGPPGPDFVSCLAPGVVPAWLLPRKPMEQSKFLQIPARMMATGFG